VLLDLNSPFIGLNNLQRYKVNIILIMIKN